MAPEGVFLKSSTHPRAYGNFARLLGKYVRDEKRDDAGGGDAPADRPAGDESRAGDRGLLASGLFADVVVFDPGDDRRPRDLREAAPVRGRHARTSSSTACRCCADGEHTGAKPGRALRGRARPAKERHAEHSWPTPRRSTGASGFVGRHVVAAAAGRRGRDVVGVVAPEPRGEATIRYAGGAADTSARPRHEEHWCAPSRARPPSSTWRRWARSGLGQTYEGINVNGTRSVVGAAHRAGVPVCPAQRSRRGRTTAWPRHCTNRTSCPRRNRKRRSSVRPAGRSSSARRTSSARGGGLGHRGCSQQMARARWRGGRRRHRLQPISVLDAADALVATVTRKIRLATPSTTWWVRSRRRISSSSITSPTSPRGPAGRPRSS